MIYTGNCPQSTEMFVAAKFQFQTPTNPVGGPHDMLGQVAVLIALFLIMRNPQLSKF
jgi:hypothetical protein